MTHIWSRAALIGALSLVAASAQTPRDIDSFTQEARVPLTSILYTGTPIPSAVLGPLTSGVVEIRELVTYSSTSKTLDVRAFLVQTGSPAVTPTGVAQSVVFESYTVDVQTITQSSVPRQSVTMTGVVRSTAAPSPFGNLVGAPVIFSFGYVPATTGNTVAVSNTTLMIPGLFVAFAPTSSGTLVFKTTSSGTGTGGGTTPVPPAPGANQPPVADAGPSIQAFDSQITLDASKSTDPDGDALSYSWRAINRSAAILNPNTARPIVQFSEGFGDYVFEVTVTDGKGGSTAAQVTVTYLGFNF